MSDDNRKLYITKNWVIVILIYYFIIFIAGSVGAVCVLFFDSNTELNIFQRALFGSISIALAAASAAYIRKLYKLCFKFSSEQDCDDQLFLKRLGTIVYFFVRPLFSILFAILVVAGVRSGIILSTSPSLEIDEGFIYLTMVSSFYVGFLSGDFIKKLELKGLKKLDSLIG
jgi:hypothetical protein